MFCPNCGAPNPETAAQCGSCGTAINQGAPAPQGAYPAPGAANPYPAAGGVPGGDIPNYLVPAILSVFCCWPMAIPAIIFATQVKSKMAAGDMVGAMEASKKAKLFSFLGLGIGIAVNLLAIIANVAANA